MKLNKLVIIATGVALLIIAVLILNIFIAEILLKNSRYIDVITTNNKKIEYDVYNKMILLFSTDCEKCIDELKWLSQQSDDIQQLVDLISISSYEETDNVIKEMHLVCNVYIDNRHEFEKKCSVSLTPSYFLFDGVKPIEIDGGLEKLIE